MGKVLKSRGLTKPPGLVYTSLRGISYLTKSIPGTNINSNGRPSSIRNIPNSNVKS